MANDRLWLRCRCGAIKLLAKYWVSKCELWDPINIDAWLTEHALNCGAEAGFFRDDAFTLHTEATLAIAQHGRTTVQREIMMFGGATFEKVIEPDGSWNWHHRGRRLPEWSPEDIERAKEEGFELKSKVPPCPQCGGHLSIVGPPLAASIEEVDARARCEQCGISIELVLKLGE